MRRREFLRISKLLTETGGYSGESKLNIEQEVKSEYEGTFGTPIEEETTLEVKHEENSEHEGTFENEEDTMERKEVISMEMTTVCGREELRCI